jgi:hypothetical protein
MSVFPASIRKRMMTDIFTAVFSHPFRAYLSNPLPHHHHNPGV